MLVVLLNGQKKHAVGLSLEVVVTRSGGGAGSPTPCRRRAATQADFSRAGSIGIRLSLLPVAAKIELATAGTIAEVPGSPIPPGASEPGTTSFASSLRRRYRRG